MTFFQGSEHLSVRKSEQVNSDSISSLFFHEKICNPIEITRYFFSSINGGFGTIIAIYSANCSPHRGGIMKRDGLEIIDIDEQALPANMPPRA